MSREISLDEFVALVERTDDVRYLRRLAITSLRHLDVLVRETKAFNAWLAGRARAGLEQGPSRPTVDLRISVGRPRARRKEISILRKPDGSSVATGQELDEAAT